MLSDLSFMWIIIWSAIFSTIETFTNTTVIYP